MKTRPLSPHLSIYKLQISSALSILHRITGFFIFGCVIFFSWVMVFMLIKNMGLSDCSCTPMKVYDHVLFKTALLGLFFCVYFHFCNGIRHLFWDAGYGFDVKIMNRTGILTITAALILTAITAFAMFSPAAVANSEHNSAQTCGACA